MATAEASVADVRGHPVVRQASLVRVIEAVIGGFIFLVLLQILLNFSLLDAEFWHRYGGSFETGIGTTLRFVAIILPLSAVLGFFLGWLRISRFRTLSWPVAVYVAFFRGLPPTGSERVLAAVDLDGCRPGFLRHDHRRHSSPAFPREETSCARPGRGLGMIRVEEVHKYFGSLHALPGISLNVSKGEALVIIGPSGSGKSTLLRCINLLVEPDAGRVFIDGVHVNLHDINRQWVRQQVGMVIQRFNLFTHLTALENVMLGPIRVKSMSREQAEDKAKQLLARVGLAAKANAYPAELSGGQQQRVAIARALAMDPKAMLFDEPTSALDPEYIPEVIDVMTARAHA